MYTVSKSKKSFPAPEPHTASISDLVVLVQAPVQAARQWHGVMCVTWCACLLPSLCEYQITLLGNRADV